MAGFLGRARVPRAGERISRLRTFPPTPKSHGCGISREDRFGPTPKVRAGLAPIRETRALPKNLTQRRRTRPGSGARPRFDSGRSGRRRSSSRCRCPAWTWGRRWSRSGYSAWSDEGIDFVVGRIINPTASDNSCVPLTCSSHQFVSSAPVIDHRAGIAIVSV